MLRRAAAFPGDPRAEGRFRAGVRTLAGIHDGRGDSAHAALDGFDSGTRVGGGAQRSKAWRQALEFDPDVSAYPRPFSKAAPANYQFMALLDRNHDYVWRGQHGGDLYGPVVRRIGLDPGHAAPVALALSKVEEERHDSAAEDRDIRVVDYGALRLRDTGDVPYTCAPR